ncbi:MAG: tetratricopeptide repeat protein [Deltaproteobacteria bacterium]|nr:tetratricopeptide repeat protein [Deltaproteobacteria bacterium]
MVADDIDTPHALVDQAWDLYDARNLNLAIGRAAQAMAALVAMGEGRSPDAANACDALANAALDLAEYPVALAASARADEILDETPAIDDPNLRALRFAVAVTRVRAHRSAGSYDLAQWRLDQLTATMATAAGPVGDRAVLLNELGITCTYRGDFGRAQRAYLEAMSLVLARGDAALEAALLHNLGGVYHAMGELLRAERYARAGLSLRRAPLAVAADSVALAAIVIDAGRAAEARWLVVEALQVYEAAFPAGHVECGVATVLLARIDLELGDLDDAGALARRGVALLTRYLGEAHPKVADARATLALAAWQAGDREVALAELASAHAVCVIALGSEHPRAREVATLVRTWQCAITAAVS